MTGSPDVQTAAPEAVQQPRVTPVLVREESMPEDLSDLRPNEITTTTTTPIRTSTAEEDLDEELNLPPGRIKVVRAPDQRLLGSGSGSGSNLQIPPGLNNIVNKKRLGALGGMGPGGGVGGSLSGSDHGGGTPRSRSRSPSIKSTRSSGGGEKPSITNTTDGNSSISSLEDIVDSDILYDRAGFSELDINESVATRKSMHGSGREFSSLTPVNERMTEDTLEDVHAFSDVPRSSNASRTGSISIATGNDQMLEPLNEEDDEDDLDEITEGDEDGDGGRHHSTQQQHQVILTNLDNLSLASDSYLREGGEDDTNGRVGVMIRTNSGTIGGGGESGAGESSSVTEEAPSSSVKNDVK